MKVIISKVLENRIASFSQRINKYSTDQCASADNKQLIEALLTEIQYFCDIDSLIMMATEKKIEEVEFNRKKKENETYYPEEGAYLTFLSQLEK